MPHRSLSARRTPRTIVTLVASVALALGAGACEATDRPTDRDPNGTPAPTEAATPPAGATPTAASGDESPVPPGELGPWESGPQAPLALTEVAAAAHDGRIWVAGGFDEGGSPVDDVLVFDPHAGAWSEGPRLPEPVHHPALVSDGESLWLVGGYVGRGFNQPTDAVRRLDGEAWTAAASLPEPRAAGSAAWDGGRIVYAGGVGPGGVSADVFVRQDDAWRRIGVLAAPREHLAAASDGEGRVFVLGGRRGGLDTNVATVEVVDGDDIRRLADLPTPRGGVAAFYSQPVGACLVGGEFPGGTNPEVECIDRDGSIVSLPELSIARHGLGAAVLDGVAYVLLGGPRPGLYVSAAVERLELR